MDQHYIIEPESSDFTPQGTDFDEMFSSIEEQLTPEKVIPKFENPFQPSDFLEVSSITSYEVPDIQSSSPSPCTKTRKDIVSRIRARAGLNKGENSEGVSLTKNMQVSSEIEVALENSVMDKVKAQIAQQANENVAQHSRAKSAREIRDKPVDRSTEEILKASQQVDDFLQELDRQAAEVPPLNIEAVNVQDMKGSESTRSLGLSGPQQGRRQAKSIPRSMSSRVMIHKPKKISYANVKSKVDTGSANLSRQNSFQSNDSGADQIPKTKSGNSTPKLKSPTKRVPATQQKTDRAAPVRGKQGTPTSITSIASTKTAPAATDRVSSPLKRAASIPTSAQQPAGSPRKRESVSPQKTVPGGPNLSTTNRARSKPVSNRSPTRASDNNPSAWARLPTSPNKRNGHSKTPSVDYSGDVNQSPHKRSESTTSMEENDERYRQLKKDLEKLESKLAQVCESSEITIQRLQLETDYYKNLLEKQRVTFEVERNQWKEALEAPKLIAQLMKEIDIKGKIEKRNATEIARLKQEINTLKQ